MKIHTSIAHVHLSVMFFVEVILSKVLWLFIVWLVFVGTGPRRLHKSGRQILKDCPP